MPANRLITTTIPADAFTRIINDVWELPPAQFLTLPEETFVLFGAVSQCGRDIVSFGLNPSDARSLGEQLIRAAQAVGQ